MAACASGFSMQRLMHGMQASDEACLAGQDHKLSPSILSSSPLAGPCSSCSTASTRTAACPHDRWCRVCAGPGAAELADIHTYWLWGDALLRFCQKHGLQLPDQSAYTQGDQDLQDLTTEAIGRRYPWAEGSGELASASCSVLCQMQCRHVWQACTSDGHQVLLPGGLRAGHVFT